MLIKKLTILNQVTNQIIRDIEFNLEGLSLILDSTSEKIKDSGNGVGKTTVIKVIDLCLGAKNLKELFEDRDTSSINEDLKKYLSDNKIIAILTVVSQNKDREYILKREMYGRGNRYINDEKLDDTVFNSKLKKIFFDSEQKKPTFRELIPKFIRLQETSESNILKFLFTTVTNSQYRSIYSFLFKIMKDTAINSISIKEKEIQKIDKESKTITKVNKISSFEALKQKLNIVNDDIEKLEKERESISYIISYKDEADKKIQIETELKTLQIQLENISFEINKISKSIEEASNQKENMDIRVLENIYEESKLYLPNAIKKFGELIDFHNDMIDNRITFMRKRFEEKNKIREEYKKREKILLGEAQKYIIDKLEIPMLKKYGFINKKIEDLVEERGGIAKDIEILSDFKKRKDTLLKEIENLKLSTSSDETEKNITTFNQFFKKYTEILYGKEYFLSYNQKNDFPVLIEELNSKLGSGEKKGLIAAFDLSYLEYSNLLNISAPKFIIHDKLELTHINQLSSIFTICEEIKGQYILPILRERIEKDRKISKEQIEKAKVLELSQDSKFFKF